MSEVVTYKPKAKPWRIKSGGLRTTEDALAAEARRQRTVPDWFAVDRAKAEVSTLEVRAADVVRKIAKLEPFGSEQDLRELRRIGDELLRADARLKALVSE